MSRPWAPTDLPGLQIVPLPTFQSNSSPRRIFQIATRVWINMESTSKILQLPAELILMILPTLAEEDQVCFSLSCKYFHNCLLSFLRTEKLQLAQPRLLPRDTLPILSPHVNKEPKIDLLRRLQNENWEYCHDCQILHPKPSSIDTQSGFCSSCKGHCDIPCSCGGRCMPFAGMVALGPCLIISFCDKLAIMHETLDRIGREFDFVPSVYRKSELSATLHHECSVNHPTVDAHLRTSIKGGVRDSESHMIIRSKYEFKFSHERFLLPFKAESMCPPKDIKDWLRQFFAEAGSSFSGWCCRQSDVPITSLPDVEVSVSTKEKHTLVVSFSRDLGSWGWPDEFWTHHRLS